VDVAIHFSINSDCAFGQSDQGAAYHSDFFFAEQARARAAQHPIILI